MSYEALIFDLDGTLIDTERPVAIAGQRALARLGFPDTAALMERCIGRDGAATFALMQAELGPIDRTALDRAWDEEAATLYALGIDLRPGVAELLDALDAAALPRAICTSSRRDSAVMKLTRTGLLPRFQVIVTRDDVTRAKPDPEPFLLAAYRLGAEPSRCLAFEDSETGAEAARRAGMTVLQIPDMQRPDGRHAHHVAPDILSAARWAGVIDEVVARASAH